jgi:hypothetical protein
LIDSNLQSVARSLSSGLSSNPTCICADCWHP